MTENHPVIFVGAGPGDPELITVKGQKALARADLVLYAGSLVSPAVLGWANPAADLVDTAKLNLEEICARLMAGHRAGRRVVRVHSGDPALFGAIQEQLEILERENIPCLVIPGVSAAFAAAAALAQELTLPEVTQTVILTRAAGRTPVPEREALHDLARHGATLVIYLSIKLIDTRGGRTHPGLRPGDPGGGGLPGELAGPAADPGHPRHHCRAGQGLGHRAPGLDHGGPRPRRPGRGA